MRPLIRVCYAVIQSAVRRLKSSTAPHGRSGDSIVPEFVVDVNLMIREGAGALRKLGDDSLSLLALIPPRMEHEAPRIIREKLSTLVVLKTPH